MCRSRQVVQSLGLHGPHACGIIIFHFWGWGALHMCQRHQVVQPLSLLKLQYICTYHSTHSTVRCSSTTAVGVADDLTTIVPSASPTFCPPPPSRSPSDPITVVALSRLVYRKGIDLLALLLPAMCRRHPHVTFIIGTLQPPPACYIHLPVCLLLPPTCLLQPPGYLPASATCLLAAATYLPATATYLLLQPSTCLLLPPTCLLLPPTCLLLPPVCLLQPSICLLLPPTCLPRPPYLP